MSAITKNLPWFIRDLGTSIVGEKCYVSLVEELDIWDTECLKYAASKGVGLGIVVGGSIMKVPQLLIILNSKSARGLSLPAYVLETLAYAITTVYSWRNQYPFSTYGENFFLTIQNVIITFLIVLYAPPNPRKLALAHPPSPAGRIISLTVGTVVAAAVLLLAPPNTLQALQLSTLPLSLFSKLPQIAQNQRARSTGQLSAFAVASQVAGCAARLFTNSTEVGDSIQAAGFFLALVLNLVLGAQMVAFWGYGGESSEIKTGYKATNGYEDEKFGVLPQRNEPDIDIVVPPKSPAALAQAHQTAHQAQSSVSGRRWARKVD